MKKKMVKIGDDEKKSQQLKERIFLIQFNQLVLFK